MISELRMRGLGVIDEAALELHPGLTVVTGETGAGKTMVVTALGLLLGARADSGLVRTGAAAAVVEGRFESAPTAVVERVADAGGQLDDDGTLLVSRTLSGEGRSRAHLGGRSVPVGVLGELADHLVQVHGQGDQQRLLKPSAQREALDQAAGSALWEVRDEYAATFDALRGAQAELDDVRTRRAERAHEAERLRFLLDELERLDPQPGEDAALRVEIERLGHADVLHAAATAAHVALLGDEDALDGVDALGLIAAARRALDAVREHDPALAEVADRLAEASYALVDTGSDLSGYLQSVEADPGRLQVAQERLAELTAAARTRDLDSTDDLLRWGQRAAARHAELDDDGTREVTLVAEVAGLRAALGETAARLSELRTRTAVELGARITAELTELAMPHATVTVAVTQRPDPAGLAVGDRVLAFGSTGVDEVTLELVPHPGAPARPLHKGASGGELSRVMLAVEVVLAGADEPGSGRHSATFVFDEVDAGVGGRAAVEVGRRLALLARTAQVLVVTHLPQVAAFGDLHLVVEKSTDGRVTSSGVRALQDSERVNELSRMLAGIEGSELALGHAEELLAAAEQTKTSR